MKQIKLTQGQSVLVDDEDFAELSKNKWHLHKGKHTFYARGRVKIDDKFKRVYMHRQITDAPKGQQIDHRNGNGLDNRRSNLRFCTNGQNGMNRCGGYGSSKYKGVHWDKTRKKWQARIRINNKNEYLGRFSDEIDAGKRYDEFAKKLYGEFAHLNFSEVA